MATGERKRPTDAELAILQVLWDGGPNTVRGVYRRLNETRETGYTTVLKLMQIMTDKGLVLRDTSVRPQVYRAATSQRRTQRQLVGHLLDRAFSGSPGNMVLQALSSKKASADERRQIRDLLDRLEADEEKEAR